jgi:hypothetical protein
MMDDTSIEELTRVIKLATLHCHQLCQSYVDYLWFQCNTSPTEFKDTCLDSDTESIYPSR